MTLPPPSKSGCRCTNRAGGKKQEYKTKEMALDQALRKHRSSVRVKVYECPTSDRWHVATHWR